MCRGPEGRNPRVGTNEERSLLMIIKGVKKVQTISGLVQLIVSEIQV